MKRPVIARLVLALGLVLAPIPVWAVDILYDLGPDWIYEEGSPGTLALTELPGVGVKVDINVPSNVEGGLSASRHNLPGLIFDVDNFAQLHYSSYLPIAVVGAAPATAIELQSSKRKCVIQ